ncbi:hypothetical protein CHL76_02175 [Marinococcus halophilus]|uniref:Scaffold protein n=1 Tax=Marinococcus halophilus TaxID=1371 RepID=A0A510Y1D2_MARHA|nr:hypothetical protein [Marinococcus halophilus]OZT81183.1 hypothetical protein CHL76_02175 [Marinococcus halophilus]GEK57116.1 hypothetical protein MHA01_00210 [Marinococcus halophilus]
MKQSKLLQLDLQYFAEGETETDSQSSDGKEKTETTGEEEGKEQQEHMIPKHRFDEVNEGYKEMKKELDAFKQERDKAEKERKQKEQEEAEKRGEYEDLYKQTQTDLEAVQQERDSANERIQSLEGTVNELLNSKLESIDESYHDLIPENLTPEQKLAWVNSAEQKGLFGNKQEQPIGEQTNPQDVQQTQDTNKMNPMEKLLSGYGRK